MDNSERSKAKRLPSLGKIGDRLWFWDADKPTDFEAQITKELRSLDGESSIFAVALYSAHDCILQDATVDSSTILGTDVAIIEVEESGILKVPQTNLYHASGSSALTNIFVSFEHKKIARQKLLLLAKPHTGEVDQGGAYSILGAEVGLCVSLFGQAIITPAVCFGFWSVTHGKLMNSSLGIERNSDFAGRTPKVDVLRGIQFDASMSEGATSSLELVARASQTKDRVAKHVYYSAALEQLLGKRVIDRVNRLYRRYPRCKEMADDAIRELQQVRIGAVHCGQFDHLSLHSERVFQAVVLDALSFEVIPTNTNFALLFLMDEQA